MKTGGRTLQLIAMAVVVAACSGTNAAMPSAPAAPAVSEARATEIATNALNAFNAGDYAAWSRDWSQAMKDAIDETAFQGFRDQVMTGKGRFVSIQRVELGSTQPGSYRYTFTVAFEKGTARVGFGFVGSGQAVEGVHFE